MLHAALHCRGRLLQRPLRAAGVVARRPPGGPWRLVDADQDASDHGAGFRLSEESGGVRVVATATVREAWSGGEPLDVAALAWREGPLLRTPIVLRVGDTVVEVAAAEALRASAVLDEELRLQAVGALGAGPAPATLTRWFEALASLHRWSATSAEFFVTAASLVVDPLGLDGAVVLRRRRGEGGSPHAAAVAASGAGWDVLAASLPEPARGVWFDLALVEELVSDPRVRFQPAPQGEQPGQGAVSRAPSFVAAPWFDASGELAGAVVGVRRVHESNGRRGVRRLEAHLTGLVADAVTAAHVRHEHQTQAARRRALLEQAFSPRLAARIERDPRVLEGRQREVTLLFADLRDSSRLFHEQAAAPLDPGALRAPLTPTETYRLLGDVMEAMTSAVVARDGVVVDYYGDGLVAMWNAPFDQPDHATRACLAALEMQRAVAEVDGRWRGRIGAPLRLAAGVHSGPAIVGDVGSRWKRKYGARGAAVNVASRVEGAAKLLGAAVVATGDVAWRIGDEVSLARLCRARVAGAEDPIALYAVSPAGEEAAVGTDAARYEQGLRLFEGGRLDAALRRLTARGEPAPATPAAQLVAAIRRARDRRRGRRRSDAAAPAAESVLDFVRWS